MNAKRLSISILSLLIVCLYQVIYAKVDVLDVPKHLFYTEIIVKDAIAKTSEEAESLAKKMIEDEADGKKYIILDTIIEKQEESYQVSVIAQVTEIISRNVLELLKRLKHEDRITIPGSVNIKKGENRIYCNILICSDNELRKSLLPKYMRINRYKGRKEITEDELNKILNF